MYDLIILGGGPAGLTSAMYAIRKRLNVLLISPDLGGKTRFHMYLPDNLERFQVITGEDMVNRFKSQVEYLEFARKLERAEKVEAIEGGYAVVTAEGNRYEARAIIVATGTGAVKLGVPGEDKYRLHGLAYSAVSYAPLFIDRTTAVVGEGELGVRSALELAQIARQVYFIVPSLCRAGQHRWARSSARRPTSPCSTAMRSRKSRGTRPTPTASSYLRAGQKRSWSWT